MTGEHISCKKVNKNLPFFWIIYARNFWDKNSKLKRYLITKSRQNKDLAWIDAALRKQRFLNKFSGHYLFIILHY